MRARTSLSGAFFLLLATITVVPASAQTGPLRVVPQNPTVRPGEPQVFRVEGSQQLLRVQWFTNCPGAIQPGGPDTATLSVRPGLPPQTRTCEVLAHVVTGSDPSGDPSVLRATVTVAPAPQPTTSFPATAPPPATATTPVSPLGAGAPVVEPGSQPTPGTATGTTPVSPPGAPGQTARERALAVERLRELGQAEGGLPPVTRSPQDPSQIGRLGGLIGQQEGGPIKQAPPGQTITTQKRLGVHLLHDGLVPPGATLNIVPVIGNAGNQPIKDETIKLVLRIEVSKKALREFKPGRPYRPGREPDWIKDYQEVHWQPATQGVAEAGRHWLQFEFSGPSALISRPGTAVVLPPIPIKVFDPGTYGNSAGISAELLGSGTEGGSYRGTYKVMDVEGMRCPEGTWDIGGAVTSWGLVVGGAKWDWTAKCLSHNELAVVGGFYTGAAGVIFDIVPGEVSFQGVIQGAKMASDFSGWFSGTIGELNASFLIVGGGLGGVYARWAASNATMRALSWSGQIGESIQEILTTGDISPAPGKGNLESFFKDAAATKLGNWVQDQADDVVKNVADDFLAKKKVSKTLSFDVDICKEGKVEKGIKKFVSGKLCGFVGRSSVEGLKE